MSGNSETAESAGTTETAGTGAARPYGGVTADERQARRRSALLEAALDVLAEGGAGAVTKRAVCARARLNDRYFYEHFAGRDTLLDVLAEEQTARGVEAVVAATLAAGPDLGRRMRAAIDAALGFLEADPRRQALLLSSHTTESLQRARLSTQYTIAQAMAAVVRQVRDEHDGREEASLDVDLVAYTLVSGTLELVSAWLRGDTSADRDELIELVAGLLLAGATL
ncbi:TetR family transcriptional regulator [Rhodococcus sp. HNM0569]|uniref:TetR/AcrR family transcriptional regulator n=1 Tax=Rhodococcus sp. HNM0569 TaxID=2716340 RepID=UPI00146B7DBF|nr:TetR family transcriptional regulator [Rhodococcus sp. HNM0569]NLU83135.1 TetR/AcrR family transcriptional regulator [Rhodococcus sp. HNM0569]